MLAKGFIVYLLYIAAPPGAGKAADLLVNASS